MFQAWTALYLGPFSTRSMWAMGVMFAKDLKRGMKTAPKLVEAILQMGYEKGSMRYTPQMQWQDRQRDLICEIAKEHGIEASFEDRRRSGQKIIKQYHLKGAAKRAEIDLAARIRKHSDDPKFINLGESWRDYVNIMSWA